jgi:hypothetical protein
MIQNSTTLRTFFDAVIMAEVKRRPLFLPKVSPALRRFNATGRVVRGVAIVRAVRGTVILSSSFGFRDGFGRSVEWVLPGPLYIRTRDRWWFFTLLLASRLGFRNLRE